ncbi:MAG TPA: DUF3795 domain-containing protein [Spirochaetales bacterium]|nr:DUF3795 domain-containing protein [Spirochaetales bacterium]
MPSTIAPCGFDCANCPVYRATLADAPAALASLWELWDPATRPATPEELRCRGCLSGTAVHIPFCAACAIRRAAMEKADGDAPEEADGPAPDKPDGAGR